MAEVKTAYLGDGVYAEFNEHHQIILTTANPYSITNKIYLESDTWNALQLFVKSINVKL